MSLGSSSEFKVGDEFVFRIKRPFWVELCLIAVDPERCFRPCVLDTGRELLCCEVLQIQDHCGLLLKILKVDVKNEIAD